MGAKVPGERLAIGFVCNAVGDWMRPIVSWRSLKPRCCKGWDLQGKASPFWYVKSKKSWIETSHFKNWFEVEFVPSARSYLEANGLPPKAILLVDNAPTHNYFKVGEIEVKFLPERTTSIIQPLDHGVIQWFKKQYWEAAALRCFRETEGTPGKQSVWFNQMKVRTALELIQEVMVEVSETNEGKETTKRCWDSALDVAETMTDEEYHKKLQHRIPADHSVQELLECPQAKALLRHLENMEGEYQRDCQNSNDNEEERPENSTTDADTDDEDKLEGVADWLRSNSHRVEVRRLLETTLEMCSSTCDSS